MDIKSDTILWDDESNQHVERTINNYGKLYGTEDKNKLANIIFNGIKSIDKNKIDRIKLLDIGCSYGQLMFFLKEKFNDSIYVGIDPGNNAIAIAKKHLGNENINFFHGYSHNLSKLENDSVDIVVLAMVMQWIPRKHLLKTIAEIDRVLKVNGIIFIEEFFPDKPIQSSSKHNSQVYIFKDFYEKYFDIYPWYKTVKKDILYDNKGGDYRKSIIFIKKYPFNNTYEYKEFD